MNKNLTPKIILIIAVLLVFLFGIFGIPKSFTPAGLLAALQDRIHLGLDLKGGTHLILQVQVNDAVNAETDRAVERLKDDLKSRNVSYGEITKPNPQQNPELISIKGVPPESLQRTADSGGRPPAGLRACLRAGELVDRATEARRGEGHEEQGRGAGD